MTFIDPAILFFLLGIFAGLAKSNLEIPPSIARFLSLYLLMALGLKGGFAIHHSGLTGEVALSLALAVLLALIIPALAYSILRRRLAGFDAAALSATYGSVSAVTFITAIQAMENQGFTYGGHMAAAMALMESPAIVISVFLANMLRREQTVVVALGNGTAALPPAHTPPPLSRILHESFTDGAQVLLLGAMLVGVLTGDAGKAVMQPFSVDLFKGMLAFFLLDMGLLAARNLAGLKTQPRFLLAYAILAPLAHAGIALCLALAAGLSAGNTALLMTLAASASYIAVPAVLRYAIPEAQPALYLGMSLGLTFPFNILIGIPLYLSVARAVVT